ncbi:MAG: M20 family metallo-hydrolase [Ginsengibacter sp.]
MDSVYLSRANIIKDQIEELSQFSDETRHISRLFGTAASRKCAQKIKELMENAGLLTEIDLLGSVHGRIESKTKNAKTFVIASHYDTVIDAGKWDGSLGIVCGIDVAANLINQNYDLPFNLEVIAFSEEEGIRFAEPYLASKYATGKGEDRMLDLLDDSGATLKEILSQISEGQEIKIETEQLKNWIGYLEIHIEQGPVLYEKNIPVSSVIGIAGQKRITIQFTGVSGHAGTVPMQMRSDALCAASEFVLEVENYALHEKRNIIGTVGILDVENSAMNVIPGKVFCSLDIRSSDYNDLNKAYETLSKACEEICRKRNVYPEWKLILDAPPILCDSLLTEILQESLKENSIEAINLVSGAGHDAVVVSKVAPVSMLFVKCYKGISHNPLENVEIMDIAAALETTDTFMINLAERWKNNKSFKK